MRLLLAFVVAAAAALAPAAAADELSERIDAVFARYDGDSAPGMSVAVVQGGAIVYERGFGLASLEHAVPNGPDTVFRIGSTSKQFTAVSLALLVLRGAVSLDDDVREHLPEMAQYAWPVRVRHLVHHTSGLRDYIQIHVLGGLDLRGFVTPADSIAAIARQSQLQFEPGTRFSYSNSNYLLMGEIVRRVSGKTLADFAEENVFEPLGMEHTHYQDDARTVVARRAWGYSPIRGGFRLDVTTWDHVGDGGVFTTVRDLARWDRHFYEPALEGGEELLALQLATEPLADGTESDYAFGLSVGEHRGLRRVSHGGAWVGYRAEMMRFPDHRLTVICLANRADVDPTRLCTQVAEIFLGDRFQPQEPSPPREGERERRERSRDDEPEPPPEPTADEAAAYVGRYWCADLQTIWSLVRENGELHLARSGESRRLRIVAPDTFRRPGLSLAFERDERGAITGFTADAGAFGTLAFERL